MNITDFHAHAFPDGLAERAISQIEGMAGIKAVLDGKVSSLLQSMDAAGIERSVVCSIATKVTQFGPILKWSKAIASDRIVPFPSVHPRDPQAADNIRCVCDEGFKGIKLHPYYQDFDLDDESLFPIYEAVQECGLVLACHTGFDIAFPRIRKAEPQRLARVIAAFPKLKVCATHLFAWQDWDAVAEHLIGKPIYTETSFASGCLPDERLRELMLRHPKEYLLFGTDSPWQSQADCIKALRILALGEGRERCLFSENAARLLA